MAASTARPEIDLRVRRNVDDLSPLDVAGLRRAFASMMAVEDDRGYQRWAGIYGLPQMMVRFADVSFLPWNRIYLARFEEALSRFEAGISLPWWNWTTGSGIPAAFDEPEAEGQPNPLHGSQIDSSAWPDAGSGGHPAETSRNPGTAGPLPDADMVRRVLDNDSFEAFASQLEILHNQVHGWLGGTNSELLYASYDPFFWVYQASIDRIWAQWQARHPDVGPPGGLGEQDLTPFEVSVAETWDAADLGYTYAEPGPRKIAQDFLAGAASDRPSADDQLNFVHYAQAFAEIIAARDTTPPLTIGIYGSWGIGKSSLLDMITKRFQKAKDLPIPVHVVEFNAWEYNSSGKIWPALVRRVMEEMERRAQWSKRARLWDVFKRNLSREWRRRRAPLAVGFVSVLVVAVVAAMELNFSPQLIVAALAALGISGAAKVASDVATNPVSKWVATLVERNEYGEELPYMREIRRDLRFLAEQMRKDGTQPRILVMIDDLDRCEPEKAVEVLQAVNQLLDFDAFVVCLGIDARVITAAVEAHYKDLLGDTGASGYEYLDKIVQIPFRIPNPTRDEIKTFLEMQMPVMAGVAPVGDGGSSADGIKAGESGYGEGSQYAGAPPAAKKQPPKKDAPAPTTEFEQVEVDAFRDLAPYIKSNPRHVKRLINVYRMVRTLAIRRSVKGIYENRLQTITWIVICAQWPYSVSGMLRAFKPHVEAVDAGGDYPDGAPLLVLHDGSVGELDPELRRKLDSDPDELRRLLERTEMSWELLRVLQFYTLNFNPAIEEALYRGRKIAAPS